MTEFDMADLEEFIAILAADYAQQAPVYVGQFYPKPIRFIMERR